MYCRRYSLNTSHNIRRSAEGLWGSVLVSWRWILGSHFGGSSKIFDFVIFHSSDSCFHVNVQPLLSCEWHSLMIKIIILCLFAVVGLAMPSKQKSWTLPDWRTEDDVDFNDDDRRWCGMVKWEYKKIKRKLIDVMIRKYSDILYKDPDRVDRKHWPSKTIARIAKKEKYGTLDMKCSITDNELLYGPKERDSDQEDEERKEEEWLLSHLVRISCTSCISHLVRISCNIYKYIHLYSIISI